MNSIDIIIKLASIECQRSKHDMQFFAHIFCRMMGVFFVMLFLVLHNIISQIFPKLDATYKASKGQQQTR
jgi:hypothetical protein